MVGVKKKNRVCKDCGKQCFQGKKPSFCSSPCCRPRPSQPSFFKIMLGDFREVLFIPPKFADKLVGLVNQNVYLEDFHGNSSRVKVSMVDGSLAFQEGWRDFVLDHSIGVGEVLVFKYVRKSLFSVQIFGINACERVHFGERSSNNLCTKNRKKADLSLERSQLPKRRKIFEASKDEYCSAKKDLEKKDDPSDSDIEITEGDCVAQGEVEYGNEPEYFPPDYHDSGSPRILDVMDITGSLVNMISGQATEEPEDKRSSPVEQHRTCVVHEISLHNRETFETGPHSDHVATFPLVEQNLSGHEDSHGKSQTAPTVACTRSETKNQIAHCWDIIPYNPKLDPSLPLNTIEKGLAGDQKKHKIRKIGLRGHRTLEVMGTNLIASEEVVCKFLLTEEGICHIVNGDLENGLGTIRVTPISLSSEICTSISCNDSVTMSRDASCHQESVPEVNCLGLTADYVEDETSNGMRASEENGNTSGSLSGKDFSPLVGSVGSTLQDMPAIDTTEGHTCQSGIVPDVLPEEDEKEDTLCLSQNLKAVKIEAMDSDDLFSPNSFCFSLTLSSNTQCWLELPQRLPSQRGKKRHERKVIILRDPSHRLWPVLYHESIKFIGFISGWKDFAIANNLQQGNLCKFFEVANEFEPTFLVQISQP